MTLLEDLLCSCGQCSTEFVGVHGHPLGSIEFVWRPGQWIKWNMIWTSTASLGYSRVPVISALLLATWHCFCLPARLGARGGTFRASIWPLGYLMPRRPRNQCGAFCKLPRISIPFIHSALLAGPWNQYFIGYLACKSAPSNWDGMGVQLKDYLGPWESMLIQILCPGNIRECVFLQCIGVNGYMPLLGKDLPWVTGFFLLGPSPSFSQWVPRSRT